MARTMRVPCRRHLACYRNDGHDGDCAYIEDEARAPLDGLYAAQLNLTIKANSTIEDLREAPLDEPTRTALAEVLAYCIEEVEQGKYECRVCDADVSLAPFRHQPECEVAYLDNRYRITRAALEEPTPLTRFPPLPDVPPEAWEERMNDWPDRAALEEPTP